MGVGVESDVETGGGFLCVEYLEWLIDVNIGQRL